MGCVRIFLGSNGGSLLIFTTCKLDWGPSFFVNVLNEDKLTKLLNECGFKVEYVNYVEENVISIIAKRIVGR